MGENHIHTTVLEHVAVAEGFGKDRVGDVEGLVLARGDLAACQRAASAHNTHTKAAKSARVYAHIKQHDARNSRDSLYYVLVLE